MFIHDRHNPPPPHEMHRRTRYTLPRSATSTFYRSVSHCAGRRKALTSQSSNQCPTTTAP